MTTRPYIILNMAISMDGKIATANRAITTFGSPRDHQELLKLRATADAVLCGARTADTEPVTLGPGGKKFQKLRLKAKLKEHNLRIIVSGNASLSPDAAIFNHHFAPILLLTTGAAPKRKLKTLEPKLGGIHLSPGKKVDLPTAMQWLRKTWKIKRLICEGGPTLNAAMFQADLIDEIRLTLCPVIVGGRTAPTITEGPIAEKLSDAKQYKLTNKRTIKNETFLTYIREVN
ncbi:MAG: riboflavin deaminase [Verrucomicrobiales bacterium]|nr:riboflavin deaminase [Verrucomicrobiales bacterium]